MRRNEMPAYVYETIPQKHGEKKRYYEFLQSKTDEPFTKHLETGEPIRRVTLGCFGMLTRRDPGNNSGSCCGSGSGCCG